MMLFRWRRSLLLSVAVVAVLVATTISIHLYARSRIAAAIHDALSDAGIEGQYEELSTSLFAKRARLHGVTLRGANRCHDCSWRLAHVAVHWSPRFDPTRIDVTIPQQDVALSAAGLSYRSRAQGQATFHRGLPQHVRFSASAGEFEGPDGTHCRLAFSVELTGTGRSKTDAPLAGRIRANADNAAPVVSLVGARPALQWMFPDALEAPFSLNTGLNMTSSVVQLRDIHGRVGPLELRGSVTWDQTEPARGALLVSTGVRRVGLRLARGAVTPDLTASEDWLSHALPLDASPESDGARLH